MPASRVKRTKKSKKYTRKTSRPKGSGLTVWTSDKPYMGNHINWGFSTVPQNHLKQQQVHTFSFTNVYKFDLYTNPGSGVVGGGINNLGLESLFFAFYQNQIQVFSDRTLIETLTIPFGATLQNMFDYFRLDKVEVQRIYGNSNSNAFSQPAVGDNGQSTNTGQLPVVYSFIDYNTNYSQPSPTGPDLTFTYFQAQEAVQITQFGNTNSNEKVQVFQPQPSVLAYNQVPTARPWLKVTEANSNTYFGLCDYVDTFSANAAPAGQGPALMGTFTYVFRTYFSYKGVTPN